MSGIGKTTLSIILGNDNNLKNDFKDGIYYLKMGQDPDLEDKQNDLLLHLENSNSKGTLKEIIKQDFADRKALLILDDVWVFEHFLPFDITKQETRSKIIITTRYGIQSFGVLDGFSEYLIEQLNEDESLAMLKQKIGWSTTDSELETICKRMSKKCGGLPLAISAVARVLATDENLKRWQDVENDFETILEKIPADEENRTVYASFQLSINYLEEELRDIYFSLSILFNKHSSFFESETLRVYWGSKSWFILKSLKEASLLTEQISQREQKGYTLHDLQKTFIKEKTKEQDLTNYKKQFIQNYQKKYAPDWHKIPFYEQNNFYHNYLEICQDLNEQNLAKVRTCYLLCLVLRILCYRHSSCLSGLQSSLRPVLGVCFFLFKLFNNKTTTLEFWFVSKIFSDSFLRLRFNSLDTSITKDKLNIRILV